MNAGTCWNEKKKATQQIEQIIELEEINQKVLAKKEVLKDIDAG